MVSNLFRQDLERLGLLEDPFRLSADPRYLYLGPEHQEVYRIIQNVILKKRGLALVTGEPGTGKSSLARFIYDQLQGWDNVNVAYVDTSLFETRTAAVSRIARAFDKFQIAPSSVYNVLMENFKAQLVDAYSQGKTSVLILDDAQKLKRPGLEVLHEMYNFDFREKVVTTIAFGEISASLIFSRYASVGSRLYTVQKLEPLSLESVMQLIAFRLQVAGRTEALFEQEAFSILYQATNGIPREVVILCSMAVDQIMVSGGSVITGNVMNAVADAYLHQKEDRLGQ